MLTDRFNRVINYLRISITDRCDLRCRYCVDKDLPFIPHAEILRYEEIIRFVRISAGLGVTKIRLTGGEPLRRKDVSYLLHEIAGVQGIADISLTTNGLSLGDKVWELKEAGLRRVNISLDTLKRSRFSFITGVDAFDAVLNSIRKAGNAGLHPVKINTVIIKGFNDDEILDFVQFAKKEDVEVRFIEFMPFGDTDLWDSSKIVTSADLEELIQKTHRLVPAINSHRGPARVFSLDGERGKVGFISPMTSHICQDCNRLRLTPDGKIKPCLFSDAEYDVKALLRSGKTNEEIAQYVRDIVEAKPERKFESGVIRKCQRSMRHTGG